MCVFVYTMTRCQHKQFQNVSECATVRGTPDVVDRGDLTLDKPAFLYDTCRSKTKTPEYYSNNFPCRKLKAIRPVPTLCTRCARQAELAARLGPVGVVGSSSGSGSSAGSSLGLVDGGGSISDFTNESGTSTPRSFWKLAHPVDLV
ncbi:hypothetical protein N8I77_005720 [Diaporthe amygdali]|uniref:Uncharacterized protein n=1 Tax=Phomopsis amygdali TaxID=1214568 RepID=A0AAD9SFH4_PHOAM|nr:hypothetical protein N8I77_005720 [Diaporthe amygdali]